VCASDPLSGIILRFALNTAAAATLEALPSPFSVVVVAIVVSSQQEMTILQQEATDLRPTLSSLVSVNGTTGEVITKVVPGSLFALGKPFFIQAHFTKPNEKDVPDHTLVMTRTQRNRR
jgi:hypothetical protein